MAKSEITMKTDKVVTILKNFQMACDSDEQQRVLDEAGLNIGELVSWAHYTIQELENALLNKNMSGSIINETKSKLSQLVEKYPIDSETLETAVRAIDALQWTTEQLSKENKRKLKENWKKCVERIYKMGCSNMQNNTLDAVKFKEICNLQLEEGLTI